MGGVFFLVMIGVVAAIIYSAKSNEAARSAWAAAGQELGLLHESGGLMTSSQLLGSIDGLRVAVDTYTQRSGKSSTTYTRYIVFYTGPLGLGLALTREGGLSGVAKFFGSQDVELGDPNFDRAVMVKAQDVAGARTYLNPDRRYRIWRAMSSWPELHVEDRQVRLEISGKEHDANRLCGIVRQLVELAGAMSPTPATSHRTTQTTGLAPPLPISPPPPRFTTSPTTPPPVAPDPEPPPPEPPPLEPPTPSAPPPVSNRPDPAPAPAASGPAVEALCAELFKSAQSATAAETVFKERFQGQTVRWQGQLRSLQRTSYDVVFGDRPITKAIFDTVEMDAGMYGSRKVQAVVQFPEEQRAELAAFTDQLVTFQGTLIRLDGLMRSIFVADATICPSPPRTRKDDIDTSTGIL